MVRGCYIGRTVDTLTDLMARIFLDSLTDPVPDSLNAGSSDITGRRASAVTTKG